MSNISQEIFEGLIVGKTKTNSNILVILVGLPYSGKSTFAEKLSKHNFVHFWATKIKKQYKLDDEFFLKLSKEIIEELLSKNYNVIFDFLNHKNEQRNNFCSIAEKMHKKVFVAYLDTPKNIILERQATVVEDVGRTNISTDIINEIESEFEIPVGENIFTIKNEGDFDTFLNLIRT
ncbi:MAG: ATP-binding protein [Candidatus Nomurabacteria bacterium]|nr:ATP-binding protein [Candidatus Nomurabacteria bacterium]